MAQTSFSKTATAQPQDAGEWRDMLKKVLLNNIRAANSSLAVYGANGGVSASLLVTATRDGRVADIRIVSSTGRASLDAALVRAASRTRQVAPFTADMGQNAVSLLLQLGTTRG